MIVYHGSGEIVKTPEIRISTYFKDFSWGFYCTKKKPQAERWAMRHAGGSNLPTINVYDYLPGPDLRIKLFNVMTDEWLDFIAACRSGKPHEYDVVEGPMADDQVWDYVEDFLNGSISREAFWALAKFKAPTHQISFHSEKALSCLRYKEAYYL